MNELVKIESDLFDAYISYKRNIVAPATIASYTIVIASFKAFMESIPPPDGNTPFISWLSRGASQFIMNKTTTRGAFQNRYSIVAGFSKWLYVHRYIDYPVIIDAVFKHTPENLQCAEEKIIRRKRDRLTKKEIKNILRILRVKNPRDYIMFLLMINLALRTDDMCSLQRKDFTLDETGVAFVRLFGKAERRKGKPMFVRIDPKDIMYLTLNYMDRVGLTNAEDYVITQYVDSRDRSLGVSKNKTYPKDMCYYVSRMLKQIIGRKVGSHCIRGSKTTLLCMDKVEYSQISKLTRMSYGVIKEHYDYSPGFHEGLGQHSIL